MRPREPWRGTARPSFVLQSLYTVAKPLGHFTVGTRSAVETADLLASSSSRLNTEPDSSSLPSSPCTPGLVCMCVGGEAADPSPLSPVCSSDRICSGQWGGGQALWPLGKDAGWQSVSLGDSAGQAGLMSLDSIRGSPAHCPTPPPSSLMAAGTQPLPGSFSQINPGGLEAPWPEGPGPCSSQQYV